MSKFYAIPSVSIIQQFGKLNLIPPMHHQLLSVNLCLSPFITEDSSCLERKRGAQAGRYEEQNIANRNERCISAVRKT